MMQAGSRVIVELGSGPGNTAYPLLAASSNSSLHVHALDYSAEAIALVRVRFAILPPR